MVLKAVETYRSGNRTDGVELLAKATRQIDELVSQIWRFHVVRKASLTYYEIRLPCGV